MRACYAALAMQASVKQYAAEVQRTQGVPIHIRVGLNTGEVVVRSIGSDLHMDYTAVGQTTHLAARMEQMAMPGSILITAGRLRLVEGYVQVTRWGPVPIKGLPEPVEVYEVTGAGPVRTRLQAAAAAGSRALWGADAELEHPAPGLERRPVPWPGGRRRRRARRGQVPPVLGVHQSHRTTGVARPGKPLGLLRQGHPYLPVIDLLKAYFQIEDRDDHATHPREGRRQAPDAGRDPEADAAASAGAAGRAGRGRRVAGPRSPATPPADPGGRQAPAAAGEPGAAPAPGLRGSALDRLRDPGLLDSLVESLPTARAPAAGQLSPRVPARLGQQDLLHQLRLDPLPPASAEELLQALLGDDPSLQPSNSS